MKTILLLTLILAAAFAHANSINNLNAQTTFTLNNPQYSWSYVAPGFLEGENLSYLSGGYALDKFYISGLNGGSGWMKYTKSFDGGYTEIYGSLFNSIFNTKTDVLTARFSGWSYSYNYATGLWVNSSVTGYFTDQVGSQYWSLNGYSEGMGGNSSLSPVPEPGTLSLLGTGLFSLGGLVLRKLRA